VGRRASWSRVIPILQQRGHNVLAVQLPLTSLADDVAWTRHVLADRLQGATVLAGHSYGDRWSRADWRRLRLAGAILAAARWTSRTRYGDPRQRRSAQASMRWLLDRRPASTMSFIASIWSYAPVFTVRTEKSAAGPIEC